MNKALSDTAINKYLSSLGKEAKNNYLYGYVEASNLDFALLGAFSYIKMKYFIIAFYENEIILLPLTMTGDFDPNQDPIVLEKSMIDDIKIKKGLIQYKITINTDGGDLKIKSNKKILTCPWQSDNIAHLESNNWFK